MTWVIDAAGTYSIARLTGPGSINRTDRRWQVHGTDLGHMFEHRGLLYLVFGDTFGRFGLGWRSNTMAYASDQDPRRGIVFDGMLTDRRGRARQLLGRGDVPGRPVTVIPTYGLSLGDRMVLHYMAVRKWGAPGRWTLGRSGLAYSDDDGGTWTVSEVSWPGDSDFGQVAFVRSDGYVYVFGISGGRFGALRLARVEPDCLLDGRAYAYWTGQGWVTGAPGEAGVVVDSPVGELSVRWNDFYGVWLLLYLDAAARAVMLRTADWLTGPWSAARPVVTAAEVPRLYAPYIPPWWNDGPDIFFTLSRYDHYDVYWWRTALRQTEDVPYGRCQTSIDIWQANREWRRRG